MEFYIVDVDVPDIFGIDVLDRESLKSWTVFNRLVKCVPHRKDDGNYYA